MTLIAAIATEHGTWMGGDRIAGSGYFTELAHPKIFKLATPDGVPYALGFAGSPRVAQVSVAVEAPARDAENRSLHWWLTSLCDALHERCAALGTLVHGGGREKGAEFAGDTDILLAIEGHIVRIGCDLAWEEPARGFECTGVGASTWQGAFEALRHTNDPVAAARMAWPIAQKHTQIGSLADEIELPR